MAKKKYAMPTTAEIEQELKRIRYKEAYGRTLKNTFFTLISIVAVFVLIGTLVLPVYRVQGTRMNPTLQDGQMVATLPYATVDRGDIIAFYHNDKVLIKRVIAMAGDTVNIDPDGNVSVNDQPLSESYITEAAFGECNIALPFQVPTGKVFVMGDDRSLSVDSRHTEIGCITQEQIIGTVIWRVWPLADIATF